MTNPIDNTLHTPEETLQPAPDSSGMQSSALADGETITPALPEGDVPLPPRPLTPGAFLAGQYEIKEVLLRGMVNFYLAHGGDYMQPSPFLVMEREVPEAVEAAKSASVESTPDESIPNGSTSAVNPIEETQADIVASLGSDPAHSEVPVDTQGNATPRAQLQSPLWLRGENFVQDGREYLIAEYSDSTSLQDWREPTNDARYLKAVSTLVGGLQELEAHNLLVRFSNDTLRTDESGQLKYFGFVDQVSDLAPRTSNLEELQRINNFLLKYVFAESGTMRLDDEWSGLALTEEVKKFATALGNGGFASIADVAAALPSINTLRIESAMRGHVGMEREVNEDSGMVQRLSRVGHVQSFDLELYAVADGMGGHEGGEIASDITLNALHDAIEARVNEGLNWRDNVAVRKVLWQIIEEVNAAVLALTEEPKYRSLRNKPGATLTFVLRVDCTLFVGNVGDSRGYLWSEAQGLRPITKDHSYVQSLIDSGQLDPAEAWGHPDGSIITSHIGMQKLKLRDVYMRLAKPGDKLLLVSDGVVDMLRDEEIAPFLSEENPAVLCENLVNASNAAGGHDNITVVCASFR